MKLYMIRHGESETNLAGCWTGWMDVPLTEKGIADARGVRPILERVSFDKIYTSDLGRAERTAEEAIPGCRYEATPLLREVNVGSFAGQPFSSLTEEVRDRIAERGYGDFGGEYHESFAERVRSFFSLVEASPYENVAAFTHAGLLHCALEVVMGIHIPRNRISCANCTVAVFEKKPTGWWLYSWINP